MHKMIWFTVAMVLAATTANAQDVSGGGHAPQVKSTGAAATEAPMSLPEALEPVVNYVPEATGGETDEEKAAKTLAREKAAPVAVPPPAAAAKVEAAAPAQKPAAEIKAEAAPAPAPIIKAEVKAEEKAVMKTEVKAQAPAPAMEAAEVPASEPAPIVVSAPEPAPAPAPAPMNGEPAAMTIPSADPAGEIIESTGGGAIPALPLDIRAQGDASFVTGGVGDEEMDMLREVSKDFNLQLMMAATSGAYVSNAFIRVLDAGGAEVITADEAGPYFYAKLPPGKYVVDITAPQGGIKKVDVTVPATGFIRPIVRFTE